MNFIVLVYWKKVLYSIYLITLNISLTLTRGPGGHPILHLSRFFFLSKLASFTVPVESGLNVVCTQTSHQRPSISLNGLFNPAIFLKKRTSLFLSMRHATLNTNLIYLCKALSIWQAHTWSHSKTATFNQSSSLCPCLHPGGCTQTLRWNPAGIVGAFLN